jgi:hypothetical protein
MRPVTTVPRPSTERTFSIGMRKGFSSSRIGSVTYSSTASMRRRIDSSQRGSPARAPFAETRTTGMSRSP